jgi:threonine synthase
MYTYEYTCRRCDSTAPATERPAGCPDCSARLEVELEEYPERLVSNDDRYDVYRYADWLPVDDIEWLSGGEGWTPLVDAPTLSSAADDPGATILLKNETTNPTWSWKDRMASMVVSHAVADGATRIATSTTGNHGSAIAAYASRAGIDRTLVFVNPSSEPPHHAQIRAYGGETVELTDADKARRLLAELADRGWFIAYDLDGHFTGQPYVYEGYKTIAFELVEQHGVPDAVVAAVGAGDGLYGIWKGFRELADAGLIEDTPAMVSAEAQERHPLANAFEAAEEHVGEDPGPEPLSTSTKSPTTGDHALAAVRNSGGRPAVIDREALEQAVRKSGKDGVFLEPASALAAAGAASVAGEEFETVVAVGSGAGVAWPERTSGIFGGYPTVEPSLSALGESVPFDLE